MLTCKTPTSTSRVWKKSSSDLGHRAVWHPSREPWPRLRAAGFLDVSTPRPIGISINDIYIRERVCVCAYQRTSLLSQVPTSVRRRGIKPVPHRTELRMIFPRRDLDFRHCSVFVLWHQLAGLEVGAGAGWKRGRIVRVTCHRQSMYVYVALSL